MFNHLHLTQASLALSSLGLLVGLWLTGLRRPHIIYLIYRPQSRMLGRLHQHS